MHYFEIYLLSDTLTKDQWQTLYKTLSQYGGELKKFQVILKITDNVVRFFMISSNDIGGLSNNLEGLILRPVDKSETELPAATEKERFVQFVGGGNLLDLKEKYAVKKGKHLQYAVINVRVINDKKALIKTHIYFQNAAQQWSKASKLMTFFPGNLLAVDFASNTRYMRKT